jgi:hypothetical protein
VQLEIAPAEGGVGGEIDHVPARPIDHLGLDGLDRVPCIAVRWQIAQKLHACSELPSPDRRNDRVRDLPDLLLLWDLVEHRQRLAVRDACIEIFELRAAHPWPPRIQALAHWPQPYRVLAESMAFPIVDVHDAADAVQAMVDLLASL